MKYLLGIDNGGTVIKAALFDRDGNQAASASARVELSAPQPGFTERNLDEVWAANAAAVREVISRANVRPQDIAAAALCGHGKGLYVTDGSGNTVYNGIVSTDSRASAYESMWNADGTADRARQKTFQSVLACQPVALLRWFKDNRPDVYSQIGQVMSAKDYIRFKLTGEIYAELTDASGTSLLNLQTRDYDAELLGLFGITEMRGCLPPLKGSADLCGYITERAARETGLAEGTPVAGGMFDIDACALAMGITDEDYICSIGGTWSINEYISKSPVKDKRIAMNSLYCLPGYYLLEECSPTSAGNLEWFINMFMGAEAAECGGVNGKLYGKIDSMVSAESTGAGAIFLPFLFASNEGAGLNASLHNMTFSSTKPQLLRAVFEGIAFSHKTHIDRLLAARPSPKAVRLAGGVANSAVWAQMFADVLNLPVQTIPDKELGCLGAAMAGGVAAGVYADLAEAASIVRIGKVFEPDSEKRTYYDRAYAAYKAYVKALK